MAKTKVINGKKIESNRSIIDVFGGPTNSRQTTPVRAALSSLNENKDLPKTGSTVLMDIPISIIRNREINKFIVGDIEELAESIYKNGLQQPIVVRQNINEDKQINYVVSIGHRRLAAYKLLFQKYGKQYEYISAKVLTSDEELKENEIYLESNSQTRKLTVFEALANFSPEEMSFEDEKFKNKYLDYMKKMNEYNEKEDKFNDTSLHKYLVRLIADVYPGMEVSEATVRKYMPLCSKASDKLKEAVYNDRVPVRKAIEYCAFTQEEQDRIINSSDMDKEYTIIVFEHKKKNKIGKQPDIKKSDDQVLQNIIKDVKHISEAIIKQVDQASKLDVKKENNKNIKTLLSLKKAIEEFKNNIK